MNAVNSAERTEVLSGEDARRREVQFMSNVKSRMDLWCDHRGPSVLIGVEQYRKGYSDSKTRGARIRVITEITGENIPYCKELMKFADLAHLDGAKGIMVVSETEFMGSLTLREGEPLKQLIYSNVKGVVEQQRYVFATLWEKAVPAEQKLREIEEATTHYQTRILRDREEIFKQIIHLTETSSGLSIVSTFGGMRLIYGNFFDLYRKVLDNYRNGKGKGIKWVGTLDRENVDIVKIFLDLGMEIRHVSNMPPMSFAVGDKELNATIEKMEGGKMIQSILASNDPIYVSHFSSIFEELWRSGIDVRERISAIEQGIDTERIEILQNPSEVQKLGWELLRSAKDEILVMFSTANAFHRQELMGTVQLLAEAAERGVKIRILVPMDDLMKEAEERLKRQHFDMRYIMGPLQTKVSILVVDRTHSLTIELKDDTKETSYEAVGLSTYSNSKPTVLSYASIFESLWIQTELYEQLKTHDAMQNEFINVAAHELRTPIQPILSAAELLDSCIIRNEQRELLAIMIRNSKRLQRLVESVLDVTKIESRSLYLKKELFNLNDVIISVMLDYENQTNKDDTKLEYMSKEDIFLEADRHRLAQVISNLLSNAIKFTRKGTICIDSRKENGQGRPLAVVSVKDTGHGIDPEIFPRLFTKFASKSDIGTGLGLFISKSIIEAHGGKIWAENNADGKGSIFTFTLPIDHSVT